MNTSRSSSDPLQRAARPRRRSLLALILVVVVAAVVDAAAGTIAAGSVAARSAAASTMATEAASEPVTGPSAPPSIPTGFPNAGQRYLSDLTITQVKQDLLEKYPDWTCDQDSGGGGGSISCEPPPGAFDPSDGYYFVNVRFAYEDREPQSVVRLEGSCDKGGPGSRFCSSVFSDVAGIAFGSDSALRKEASRWARDNTGEDNTTVIGGVRMTTELDPQSIAFAREAGGR